jgi:hypothetical protein
VRLFTAYRLLAILLGFIPLLSRAQFDGNQTYDDYGAFATDPVDLDQEYADIMGRFFQTTFLAGSGIPNGDLGKAYAAGVEMGLKFVLYMDRVWGVELWGNWGRYNGVYNEANTETTGVDIKTRMTLIPFGFSFRYGFDLDTLPRGIAMMNPYFSAGPEIVFRSESVNSGSDTTGLDPDVQGRFLEKSTRNTTGYGAHFGGGVEFDVYKKKLFAGVETRYHVIVWSDADELVGKLGRRGHLLTLMGTLNYNY